MPPFRFLFPACLLALASPALAQTAPADTAHFYKHHLGLTASPVLDHFFTANRSLPVGLLYKRQTKPGRLWRYGLVLNQNYSRRDEYKPILSTNSVKSNEEYVFNTLGISAGIGKEVVHYFSSRWAGTTGADFSVGFSRFARSTKYQQLGVTNPYSPPTEVEETDRYLYYQASLSPFIGLRFNIWPQLYVSAESAIRLAYLREIIEGYSTVTDLTNGNLLFGTTDFTGQKVTDQSLNVNYRFINQLTIHYSLP